jgi:hypothetical protein
MLRCQMLDIVEAEAKTGVVDGGNRKCSGPNGTRGVKLGGEIRGVCRPFNLHTPMNKGITGDFRVTLDI